MFDRAEGTTITWKSGKNLTVKTVKKQQKPKGGKGKRGGRGGGAPKTITVEEKLPSFFWFFSDEPYIPELDEMEEQDDEFDEELLQEYLERDYEYGLLIKRQIIQNAVNWFTGETSELRDGEEEDDEDDEGEEGHEEEINSEEDEDFTPQDKAGQPGAPQQECKQQ